MRFDKIWINRNKSCIWIWLNKLEVIKSRGLIETRVVFELLLTAIVGTVLAGLIETRVVFEFLKQINLLSHVLWLIETRVVFE